MKKNNLFLWIVGCVVLMGFVVVQKEAKVEALEKEKVLLDDLIANQKLEEVCMFQILEEKPQLWNGDDLPENVTHTFCWWQNSKKKVRVAGVYPFSQSGDWVISYVHYFDKKGNAFIHERNTNFFNSGCVDGVAYEVIKQYFDANFQLISENYSLTDERQKMLKKEDCGFPYAAPYEVLGNVEDWLENYEIK